MPIHRSVRRALWATAAVLLAVTAGVTSTAAATAAPAAPRALKVVSGNGVGSVTPPLSNAGAPLLASFEYGFTNGDHPLRRIADVPLPAQSAVEVTFADKNGDDNFAYRVSHELVDPALIQQRAFHGNCRGTCTVPLNTRPSGGYEFVLTGFRFSFDIAEHPLNEIGVSESGGRLTTTFEDQNGDDPYTYDVSYAWVPRIQLGTVSEVVNTVHQTGRAAAAIPAGETVIRGFFLDNLASGDASDNNIRELGVGTAFGLITVQYGDRNPGDSADWRYLVRYANVL